MHFYYNGILCSEEQLSPFGAGFQFGYGLFETILVTDGMPCFVDLHYNRLIKGCETLGLKLNIQENDMTEQAMKLISSLSITEGRLKVICFRDLNNDSTLMTLLPYKLESIYIEKGFSLKICSIKRNPYSPLCYLKSLNYSENILARDDAKEEGFDESLFLNVEDKVCEGSVSNIFWLKGNTLYTPSISSGILDGITRRQVIKLCGLLEIKVFEDKFELPMLLEADEVFITNSLMGIMPINKIERKTFDISDYKIVPDIQKEYHKLIKQMKR